MSCLINILLVPMKVLYQQITSRYLPVFYLQLNDVFKMKKIFNKNVITILKILVIDMYNSKVSVTRKDDSGICSEGVCFQKDGIVNYNGFIGMFCIYSLS